MNKEEVIKKIKSLLKKLIESQSVTGKEKLGAEIICEYLIDNGFQPEIVEFEQGKANVYCRYNQGINGEELTFCGHIDVIQSGDLARWDTDPFQMIEKDNLIYGRGTCDMQGNLVCMILAFISHVEMLKKSNKCGVISLLAVASEERGSLGSKYFLKENGGLLGSVIIGEPTGNRVAVTHKGRAEFTLDILGKAGHAAKPKSTVNPILLGAKILCKMEDYFTMVNGRQGEEGLEASIAVTQVFTNGNEPNTIPDNVRFIFDRRYLGIENYEDVMNEFEDMMKDITETYNIPVIFQSKNRVDAAFTPVKEKIVTSAIAACKKINGSDTVIGFEACCDMFVYRNYNIPTIIVGGGDLTINHAHGFNEFILVDELYESFILYKQIAVEYHGI